ncbi:hypothetical protein [Desulfovermiculus halophilus]|uniref:hypothetical protein n=1 Tax=Desulfovermiculus halophilus TaxID=339722 RepID=UPI000484CB94|nr:hypothetical protein [Desulfovermiculus halophilus]
MDQIVTALTETQKAELIRRLHDRGGKVRQALLEEARNVLKNVDSHEVVEEVFMDLDMIQVETLWDNSGPTRDDYISPEDEALDLMEEELEPHVQQVWDYLQFDMQAKARTYLQGILLGLYRFDHESRSEFKNWAVDIPPNLFGDLLDKWREKTGNYSRKTEIDAFCQQMCPKWM